MYIIIKLEVPCPVLFWLGLIAILRRHLNASAWLDTATSFKVRKRELLFCRYSGWSDTSLFSIHTKTQEKPAAQPMRSIVKLKGQALLFFC